MRRKFFSSVKSAGACRKLSEGSGQLSNGRLLNVGGTLASRLSSNQPCAAPQSVAFQQSLGTVLFLSDALQLHVITIKRETAQVGDVHRFHRHDNIFAGETDGTRAGIAETVLPSELPGVSVDFARTGRIRRGAVAVGIGRIKCNLERATALMDAEFKNALPIQKFLVYEFAI